LVSLLFTNLNNFDSRTTCRLRSTYTPAATALKEMVFNKRKEKRPHWLEWIEYWEGLRNKQYTALTRTSGDHTDWGRPTIEHGEDT